MTRSRVGARRRGMPARRPGGSGGLPFEAGGLIAGVDEAGRGPLAGPVVAAAVILDPLHPVAGLADSKVLPEAERVRLAAQIRGAAFAWGIGMADPAEIDALNILEATWLAMRRALLALRLAPCHVQFDGNRAPSLARLGFSCTFEAIIAGDASIAAISAASILAKTTRDAWMCAVDARFPEYGFVQHKGYPTPAHLDVLGRLGPTPLHRRSFAPVKSVIRR